MLDLFKIYPSQEITVNKKVTVHEHRAPTDKSIELYHELLEKAKTEILETFTLDNNIIKANVVVYRDAFLDDINVSYIFNINGKKYKDKIQINSLEMYISNRTEVYRLIYQRIAQKLTDMLCDNIQAETKFMNFGK